MISHGALFVHLFVKSDNVLPLRGGSGCSLQDQFNWQHVLFIIKQHIIRHLQLVIKPR